ncbi:hypothetical protein BGZ80_003794 [Entomortierella chlamydospora]|uniref:Uncharacterized protein n=1 Tax=Entomortierella chlamydospora TaxID=101097 RepID=A0A9P6T2X2_9FUNG|nr:hypothetical protein BGZ80_003794 [Entomortierella chlamydospora]
MSNSVMAAIAEADTSGIDSDDWLSDAAYVIGVSMGDDDGIAVVVVGGDGGGGGGIDAVAEPLRLEGGEEDDCCSCRDDIG